MTTVQISNGDIFVNDDNGRLGYLDGIEEASQSVARHILSEYNSFFDEGNELITFSFGGSFGTLTDSLVDQYLTEAVNRLIIKQQQAGLQSRILKVNQIKTRLVGMSTVVFLIEVLFDDGQTVSVVDKVNIKPTALDHILDPSAFIEV
jgi:hypothetical protein